MLSDIKLLLKRALGRGDPSDPTAYWQIRAKKYGKRAVLNLAHPASDYESVTQRQKDVLFPLLRSVLSGSERGVLDFGCGPGRFTALLAEIVGGPSLGVDISSELIKAAPRRPSVSYQIIDSSADIRPSFPVDVIWICLVLGGIDGPALQAVATDLEDRLESGGLLFLVENVSAKADGAHWKFRSVDQYRSLFPSVDLRAIGAYTDVDEEMVVLAGRKTRCQTPE